MSSRPDNAKIYPTQGHWTEADYLALTTNRLVEFRDGRLEVIAWPTMSHQLIPGYLLQQLKAVTSGETLMSPLPVKLREGCFREPDIIFIFWEHGSRMGERYWTQPDMVMEIVGEAPESYKHDWVTKRDEYAKAGITEYWIIDQYRECIALFSLVGDEYALLGKFGAGEIVKSVLLKDFSLEVTEVLAAAELRSRGRYGQLKSS